MVANVDAVFLMLNVLLFPKSTLVLKLIPALPALRPPEPLLFAVLSFLQELKIMADMITADNVESLICFMIVD